MQVRLRKRELSSRDLVPSAVKNAARCCNSTRRDHAAKVGMFHKMWRSVQEMRKCSYSLTIKQVKVSPCKPIISPHRSATAANQPSVVRLNCGTILCAVMMQ